MISNNLISLIQSSHGNSKKLTKILNSGTYKELSSNEQVTTLFSIIENSAGDNEVLIGVIEELKSKLYNQEFFTNPGFFNVLISLIKYAKGNKHILMKILDNNYDDICSNISNENIDCKQIELLFITIAENADGDIEIFKKVLAQIVGRFIYSHKKSIPVIVVAVINCARGNIIISEKILTQYSLVLLKDTSSEQQKIILSAISSSVINMNITMLENIMELACSLTKTDLKEILIILAQRSDKNIDCLTRIIDCAHENLPSQQQKDFLIELIEITNKNPTVVAMIAEQAQYLLSPYDDEVLKVLASVKEDTNNTLLSFTSPSLTLKEETSDTDIIKEEELKYNLKLQI